MPLIVNCIFVRNRTKKSKARLIFLVENFVSNIDQIKLDHKNRCTFVLLRNTIWVSLETFSKFINIVRPFSQIEFSSDAQSKCEENWFYFRIWPVLRKVSEFSKMPICSKLTRVGIWLQWIAFRNYLNRLLAR